MSFRIASDDEIELAVDALLYPSSGTPSKAALVKAFEEHGGVEAFTEPKLTPEMRELRNTLLGSANFPIDTYYEVVDKTVKFGRGDLYALASRPEVFESYPLFKRFWDVNADDVIWGFHTVVTHKAVHSPTWSNTQWYKNGPTEHYTGCPGASSKVCVSNCRKKRIFLPHNGLATSEWIRDNIYKWFDPLVVEPIQDNVLGCSAFTRSLYARAWFVRDDHWALLAADPKREVLNSLVGNSLLPTEIALEIAVSYKTPFIREQLARHTVSGELLGVIWSSTKSAGIREVVEDNPFFKGSTA